MALFGRETESDRQRAQEWADWVQRRNPLAIISLVLGIFSLIELGAIPVFSIAGVVLGILGLRQLRRPDSPHVAGHRLAVGGIVVSSIALLMGCAIYIHSYVLQ
jgi:hypothetical protein